jgi:Arc/MetJ family transcription regulator
LRRRVWPAIVQPRSAHGVAGMPLSGLTRDSDVYENTINIDDSLLDNAAKLTGVKEKTSLVRLRLEALIAKGSTRRLANLGGTEKRLRAIRDGGLVDDDWMVRSNFLLPTYTNGSEAIRSTSVKFWPY